MLCMAVQLTSMKGEEFAGKILAGERDFSRIKLGDYFDLAGYERFNEMNDYLARENLRENPVILNGSRLIGIRAGGLHLPYTKAEGANLCVADLSEANLYVANLSEANLWGADLREADLSKAYLSKAYLSKAYLSKADLREADLSKAYLSEANLSKADLSKADLSKAYLSEAKNLENALNLADARFYETRVTETEKTIIEKALGSQRLFIVD